MPSNAEKKPDGNLKDKLSSLFGSQNPQRKKDALPPKAHFSIWYFLIAFLLFTLIATILSVPKSGDHSLQQVQTGSGRRQGE